MSLVELAGSEIAMAAVILATVLGLAVLAAAWPLD